MSKCQKSKTPCKICLQKVTQKNGLQCQGACKAWVHYGCVNYTPGKIKDIKAGIITVTCPCPDCKSAGRKEYRTEEPFSCSNHNCPSHKPPLCDNSICPSNPNPPKKCGKDCKENKMPIESPSSSESPCCSSEDIPGDMQRGSGSGGIPLACVRQMVNTVGQLTNQLNSLMSQMQQIQDPAGSKGKQKGQCLKPCNCPGNPARRTH